MKKIIAVFFFAISLSVFAQETEDDYKAPPKTTQNQSVEEEENDYYDNKFFKRFYLGGNFWVNFSSAVSYIQLSPLIGYKVTRNFSVGGGIEYFYYGNRIFNTNFYGGSVFTRYRIIPQAFVHVEYKYLNVKYYNVNTASYNRAWIDALLLGGGYSQKISKHLYSQVFLLVDVINHPLYPFSNPIINIGVNYGF